MGGTSPALINVPGLFSLPGSLERLLPGELLPPEMRPGKGDGLVTAQSAIMPGTQEHLDFEVNHAAVAVDPGVRRASLDRLEAHCLAPPNGEEDTPH